MLSLYAKQNDVITIDNKEYPINLSFNRVLANIELSQNEKISDEVKVKYYLMNYLKLTKKELDGMGWDYLQQREIYLAITMKLFSGEISATSKNTTENDDKSVYSFSEDADFIFSSFLKDYKINLIEERDKLHWYEFKALFNSLSQDTKMIEVIRIRQWKKSEHDTKEYVENMLKLQKIYALKQSQQEFELVEVERQKMAAMTSDERVKYAKEQLKKLEEGG